jgi:DNA helicase-2/ATP-dependent DNA helicase PcrA
VAGVVHRWRFASATSEAAAIADSCRRLIAQGISANDILLLVGNQPILLPTLKQHFEAIGVAFEAPANARFVDSPPGRQVFAVVRIVCNPNDYVSYRTLLGLRHGVGIGTCAKVTDAVIAANMNYRSIFYQQLPAGLFSDRALTAVNGARAICSQLQGWQADDTLNQRMADLGAFVSTALGAGALQQWQTFAAALPGDMTISELRDYLSTDTDQQQALILQAVLSRLNQPIPEDGELPSRVRIMTMHGAKGLSAKVVFIPGLEEQVLPGPWRQPYPGLVLEAARLLYVSLTRARAACIVSYAQTRTINGQFQQCQASRFAANLGGPFVFKNAGLSDVDVDQVVNEVGRL